MRRRRLLLVATGSLVAAVVGWLALGARSPGRLPAASGSATSTVPSPTVVPVGAWEALNVRRLQPGPLLVSDVAYSTGAYVALGQSEDLSRTVTLWRSADGLRWIEGPAPFLPAPLAFAAPCAASIVVVAQSPTGSWLTATSGNGSDWLTTATPELSLKDEDDLAGNEAGVLTAIPGAPARIAFSDDCRSWAMIPLTAPRNARVSAVAALGLGFVAVGDNGANPPSPIAWFSTDGRRWEVAATERRDGEGFVDVKVAANGLIALGRKSGSLETSAFWTSAHGDSWDVGQLPLHDTLGAFEGDGIRLIGYGRRIADGGVEQWISSVDGLIWEPMVLTGDTDAVASGQAHPFVLDAGVLFSDFQGAWIGIPPG